MQFVLNGLIAGSAYVLVALSFMLIYRPARFFHLAHGAAYTAGAYTTLVLVKHVTLPLPIAALIGACGAGALGVAMEMLVYRQCRRRGATPLVLLLVSLGMYVVLQNVISLVFGDEVKTLRTGGVTEGVSILGARVTTTQLLIAAVSVVSFALVSALLNCTRWGKGLRAVSSDRELASVCGVDSGRVFVGAFAAGSALAGLAGVLVAIDVDMTPTMGLNATMMAVVAVIIGGADSSIGVAVGALGLGMAQHLGVSVIGSQWQDAIAFAILLAFLLLRPQGVLGRASKRATLRA